MAEKDCMRIKTLPSPARGTRSLQSLLLLKAFQRLRRVAAVVRKRATDGHQRSRININRRRHEPRRAAPVMAKFVCLSLAP